jgi:hypothetical protein
MVETPFGGFDTFHIALQHNYAMHADATLPSAARMARLRRSATGASSGQATCGAASAKRDLDVRSKTP